MELTQQLSSASARIASLRAEVEERSKETERSVEDLQASNLPCVGASSPVEQPDSRDGALGATSAELSSHADGEKRDVTESETLCSELREANARLQSELVALKMRLAEQEGDRLAMQRKNDEIDQKISQIVEESERVRLRNSDLERLAEERLLEATQCGLARSREKAENVAEIRRLREDLKAAWDATEEMRSTRDSLAAELEEAKSQIQALRGASAQEAAETDKLVREIVRALNERLSQNSADANVVPTPERLASRQLANNSFAAAGEGEWGSSDLSRRAAHKRVASETVGLGRWFGPEDDVQVPMQSEALLATPSAPTTAAPGSGSPNGLSPVQKIPSPTSPQVQPTLSPTFGTSTPALKPPREPLSLRELDDSLLASSQPSAIIRGEASALTQSSRRPNLQQDVVALTVLRYLYSSKRVSNTSRLARFVNYLRDLLRRGLDFDCPAEVRARALTGVLALLQHFYCGDIELADYFDFLKNYEVEKSVVMKQSFGISAYSELFKELDLSRKEATRLKRILDENGIPYDSSYKRYKQEKLRRDQMAGRSLWASGVPPSGPRLSGSLSARESLRIPQDVASTRLSQGMPAKPSTPVQINARYNSLHMAPNPYYPSRPQVGDRRQTSSAARQPTSRPAPPEGVPAQRAKDGEGN